MDIFTALKNRAINAAGIFIVATILSNFINFAFNAYLGRALSAADFGLITFVNTLVLLSGVFVNAMGSSVTHRVAYLNAEVNKRAGLIFTNTVKKKTLILSLAIMFVWVLLIPFSSKFFRIGDIKSLIYFTPVFALFLNGVVFKGFLTGSLYFIEVSIALVLESLSKFIFAVLLTVTGFGSIAYLAIPLSLVISFSVLYYFGKKAEEGITFGNKLKEADFAFPRRFLGAATITNLSTTGFLTLDLIMVKHYLLPAAAGEYSLLSLAGKMIFFFGSLFNALIITYVSHDLGASKNPGIRFNKLIWGVVTLTLISYVGVGLFGSWLIPLAFGDKARAITSFLPTYAFAISLFTVATSFTIYHLARHRYSFSFISLCSSVLMITGIFLFHAGIGQITQVILAVSLFNFSIVVGLHLLQSNGQFILRNVIDLLGLVSVIPNQKPYDHGKQRILIFNWRDTRHNYAGGAEVYIHELAKRWVEMGNSVTEFVGSDGESPRNQVVDGIQVVRRGGFYFVYFWAFLYYVLRFRGHYDVIIDCENGLPFFTPMYAKEKVYCLMFHVHQEVFRKSLPAPLAAFASILENRLMPWAYRKTKFITISESSKKEIEELGLGRAGIEIVYPGIDLRNYKPDFVKNKRPLVAYVGRLQLYKSIDVFIRSLKKVLTLAPETEIIIAGDGEERGKLERLVESLGLKDKVRFLGKVAEEEKIKIYQKAWVAVNPSLKEGWGITTIEANACGTPVVASDVPGLRDSVRNPSTGFLVEYGNENEFSRKILEIINDDEMREYMQRKSVEWARNFEWHTSAQKGLNIIL